MRWFFRRIDTEMYCKSVTETLFFSHLQVPGRDQVIKEENITTILDSNNKCIQTKANVRNTSFILLLF